jgi:hypothetical protein
MANGTFTGTGQSATVVGRKFDIVMDFAGTASVDIEVQTSDGGWVKIPSTGTGITADAVLVCEFVSPKALRLNCTAHTNNVEYDVTTGPQG